MRPCRKRGRPDEIDLPNFCTLSLTATVRLLGPNDHHAFRIAKRERNIVVGPGSDRTMLLRTVHCRTAGLASAAAQDEVAERPIHRLAHDEDKIAPEDPTSEPAMISMGLFKETRCPLPPSPSMS